MIKKLIDKWNILSAENGIQQLLIIWLLVGGFYHFIICDELVQPGDAWLVDIDKRVKPEDDLHDLEKDEIQAVFMFYMYQFMRKDLVFLIFWKLISQENGI